MSKNQELTELEPGQLMILLKQMTAVLEAAILSYSQVADLRRFCACQAWIRLFNSGMGFRSSDAKGNLHRQDMSHESEAMTSSVAWTDLLSIHPFPKEMWTVQIGAQ